MSYHIERKKELTSLNTMGIKAYADYFVSIGSIEDLRELLDDEIVASRPLFILGGGSNILLTSDFNGLVIRNNIQGIEKISETDEHVYLKIGAGVVWHELVLWAIDHNYGGIENLSLIPGTVGAAPMQNIGAYGVEIREVFESLDAVELSSRKLRTFSNEDCEFGYRTSVFKTSLKGSYVICSVTLRLSRVHDFNISYGAIRDTLEEMKVETLSLRAVSEAVIRIRQSKLPDPALIGNAGSFFKNPIIEKIDYEGLKAEFGNIPGYEDEDTKLIKVPAGWLIEQCGWKGKRRGAAGVHDRQALVLVNHGEATGEEIRDLAKAVQDSVSKKFGILIEPEVNMI